MIHISNVSKSFGDKKVINNLSCEIDSGQITALVGKNGCGKTTLIRMLSGLYIPDKGFIDINNHSLGVLIGGDVNLYTSLSGYENIRFFAMLHNMSSNIFKSRCDELSRILNFRDFMHEKTAHYSRGMKQKIALAISIIHDPDTILLDEPSTGLDICTAFDVITFIDYCSSIGKTVLISTHNPFEITDLCNKTILLKNGRIDEHCYTKEFFSTLDAMQKIKILSSALEE